MTEVVVQAGEVLLDGILVVPDSAKGLVVFVHGTGAAANAMQAPCRIEIVEGATHLFGEPGKLEQVATRVRDWFLEQSLIKVKLI